MRGQAHEHLHRAVQRVMARRWLAESDNQDLPVVPARFGKGAVDFGDGARPARRTVFAVRIRSAEAPQITEMNVHPRRYGEAIRQKHA